MRPARHAVSKNKITQPEILNKKRGARGKIKKKKYPSTIFQTYAAHAHTHNGTGMKHEKKNKNKTSPFILAIRIGFVSYFFFFPF